MTSTATPDLLSGLADELASMIPVVAGLSALVFDHAIKAPAEDRPRILTQAQAVDDLGQRLDALSNLATALSRGVPVNAALDALPLAEVAGRLRIAALGLRPATDNDPASGELVLFD